MPFIEPLEARIAPAVLVNPTTLSYVDVDGDHVTVQFSKPILTSLSTAQTIFGFNTGSVVAAPTTDSTEQQLELINLDGIAAAAGANVTVTAKYAGDGDGYAAVGYIEATTSLGAVSIAGDLGGIKAGSSSTTVGLKSLTTLSLGEYGLATQGTIGSFTPSLADTITGSLGALTVKTDMAGSHLTADGIGSIKIGGSLIGVAIAHTGTITSTGNIGAITLGGNLDGGAASNTGNIVATGSIASLSIGGSINGASGSGSSSSASFTGYVSSGGNIGAVKIGQELFAGHFDESGKIISAGSIASITIGGSIVGGDGSEETGADSTHGQIAAAGDVGTVKISGGIIGGDGIGSASIQVARNLGQVTVGGIVEGGAPDDSGLILSDGNVAGVTIVGSLVGGGGADTSGSANSGAIFVVGALGPVKIGGNLTGGDGGASGLIQGEESVASVTIGGSITGGSANDTGEILSNHTLGSVVVGQTIEGGSGVDAGDIRAIGNMGKVTVGGSLIGGSGSGAGSVYAQGGSIASISVGGSVISGSGPNSGIYADNSIGAILVKGNVFGTTAQHAEIEAVGLHSTSTKTDVAIKSVTILGNADFADILGGREPNHSDAAHENADAQIGAVKIGGSFIGSNIAAGVNPGASGFGSGATVISGGSSSIESTIASIVIGGQAIGKSASDSSGVVYGIVAQDIGSIKVGSAAIALKSGPDNDTTPIPLGISGDLFIYEL